MLKLVFFLYDYCTWFLFNPWLKFVFRYDSSHTILIILMNQSCGVRAITRATTTRQSGWSTTFAWIWMHSMATNTMGASTMGLQSFSGNGQKETTNAGRLFPTVSSPPTPQLPNALNTIIFMNLQISFQCFIKIHQIQLTELNPPVSCRIIQCCMSYLRS